MYVLGVCGQVLLRIKVNRHQWNIDRCLCSLVSLYSLPPTYFWNSSPSRRLGKEDPPSRADGRGHSGLSEPTSESRAVQYLKWNTNLYWDRHTQLAVNIVVYDAWHSGHRPPSNVLGSWVTPYTIFCSRCDRNKKHCKLFLNENCKKGIKFAALMKFPSVKDAVISY